MAQLRAVAVAAFVFLLGPSLVLAGESHLPSAGASTAVPESISAAARTSPRRSFNIRSLKEIRETGVVRQQWETSCAAAAIATVLTYAFQDPVTERYAVARMLEKTDPAVVRARRGFSLLDLKRFVEERGYRGDAYQYLSVDDLKLFRAPIVPIRVFGSNHYVVVNAFNGDEVLIADPAFGNRTMSIARFEEAWMEGLAFIVSVKAEKA